MDKAFQAHLRERFAKGSLFEGKFRIEKHLGTGSFAYVMRAKHEAMERRVALKILKPELLDQNPELRDRFVNEVKIVAKLSHANTVTVFDYGRTEDGIHYLVMEYVEGPTLDEVIQEQGALPPHRATSITQQILKSLAEAHSFGIVHRDLKPQNIMLTYTHDEEEIAKVLDFGVAKLVGRRKPKRNEFERRSTQFVGTPMYMSPEQVLGQDVVPASDLYSLGLILYEMLTGEDPIKETSVAQIAQAHIDGEPLPFAKLDMLTARFQQLILRATSRAVEDRFADVGSFARALPDSDAGQSNEFAELLLEQRPEGLDDVSEHTWEAFSGKNYLEAPQTDASEGRQGGRARPAPKAAQPPGLEAPRRIPPSSSVKLDVSHVRSGEMRERRDRRAADVAVVERRDWKGPAWCAGGVFSAWVAFIVASTVFVDGTGGDRWFVGLLPVGIALVWSHFAGVKRHHGPTFHRVIVPAARHMVYTTASLVLFTALVTPEAAASRMQNVGTWFADGFADQGALSVIYTATKIVASVLAALFSFSSAVIPW